MTVNDVQELRGRCNSPTALEKLTQDTANNSLACMRTPPPPGTFSLLDEVLFITSHSELYITGAVTRASPGNISCGRRPL